MSTINGYSINSNSTKQINHYSKEGLSTEEKTRWGTIREKIFSIGCHILNQYDNFVVNIKPIKNVLKITKNKIYTPLKLGGMSAPSDLFGLTLSIPGLFHSCIGVAFRKGKRIENLQNLINNIGQIFSGIASAIDNTVKFIIIFRPFGKMATWIVAPLYPLGAILAASNIAKSIWKIYECRKFQKCIAEIEESRPFNKESIKETFNDYEKSFYKTYFKGLDKEKVIKGLSNDPEIINYLKKRIKSEIACALVQIMAEIIEIAVIAIFAAIATAIIIAGVEPVTSFLTVDPSIAMLIIFSIPTIIHIGNTFADSVFQTLWERRRKELEK